MAKVGEAIWVLCQVLGMLAWVSFAGALWTTLSILVICGLLFLGSLLPGGKHGSGPSDAVEYWETKAR